MTIYNFYIFLNIFYVLNISYHYTDLCCTTLVLPLIANALDSPNRSNVGDKMMNIYFSFVFAQVSIYANIVVSFTF